MKEYIVHVPTDNALAVEEYATFYGELVKELIRCKDCKWNKRYRQNERAYCLDSEIMGDDFYCGRAKRKEL